MTARYLSVFFPFALACAAPKPVEDPPPSPPVFAYAQTLAPRADLAPGSKRALAERMRRHRAQMGALTLAVWLLDYERIARLADELANTALMDKPVELDDDPLLPHLPASFFLYQRELQQSAAVLAGAARVRDDTRISESFSGVSRSCIGCHAAYLHDPLPQPGPPPSSEPAWIGDARPR